MKFIASRLSAGNKIFPSEIYLEPTGITIKIPGLFSGENLSLTNSSILLLIPNSIPVSPNTISKFSNHVLPIPRIV